MSQVRGLRCKNRHHTVSFWLGLYNPTESIWSTDHTRPLPDTENHEQPISYDPKESWMADHISTQPRGEETQVTCPSPYTRDSSVPSPNPSTSALPERLRDLRTAEGEIPKGFLLSLSGYKAWYERFTTSPGVYTQVKLNPESYQSSEARVEKRNRTEDGRQAYRLRTLFTESFRSIASRKRTNADESYQSQKTTLTENNEALKEASRELLGPGRVGREFVWVHYDRRKAWDRDKSLLGSVGLSREDKVIAISSANESMGCGPVSSECGGTNYLSLGRHNLHRESFNLKPRPF